MKTEMNPKGPDLQHETDQLKNPLVSGTRGDQIA